MGPGNQGLQENNIQGIRDAINHEIFRQASFEFQFFIGFEYKKKIDHIGEQDPKQPGNGKCNKIVDMKDPQAKEVNKDRDYCIRNTYNHIFIELQTEEVLFYKTHCRMMLYFPDHLPFLNL
jgi:hypothetical protein